MLPDDTCSAGGLPDEEFRARFAEDARPAFHTWDVHWAPTGHELAARVVGDRLRGLGLLPDAQR